MRNHISNIHITNQSKQAVIEIEGEIGVPENWQFETDSQKVATYDSFSEKLEKIRAINSESVRVNIRSMGGNVNDALLIYEALQSLEIPISTHCYGYVASAATIIAQAASEGERYMSENSLYLIHSAVTDITGNKNQILRAAELLEKTDQRIAELYSRHSTMTPEQCTDLMTLEDGNGSWLNPNEALEIGLIDIIESVSQTKELGQKVKNFLRNVINPELCTEINPSQASRIAAKLTEKPTLTETPKAISPAISAIEPAPQKTTPEPPQETQKPEQQDFQPTLTAPTPDPVCTSIKLTANQNSYQRDVELFA